MLAFHADRVRNYGRYTIARSKYDNDQQPQEIVDFSLVRVVRPHIPGLIRWVGDRHRLVSLAVKGLHVAKSSWELDTSYKSFEHVDSLKKFRVYRTDRELSLA